MSNSDVPVTPVRPGVTSTPRSVAFASAPTFYEQELDDILDLSSSSESDEAEDLTAARPHSSGPIDDDRGHIKSTHLERNDYRALLESLRTVDQHDTAKHLMSAAMLSRSNDSPALRKLRKGWTAWPLAQSETKHSRNAESTLRWELGAVVHAQMVHKLREQKLEIVADELPPQILDVISGLMMDKLTDLLKNMARARLNQGGVCRSTNKRLGTLDHHVVLDMAKHSGVISEQGVERVMRRSNTMFGTSTVKSVDIDTSPCSTPSELLAEELAIGPGNFHLRGTKRLRKADEGIEHSDEDLSSSATILLANSPRAQRRSQRGEKPFHNRYSKDTQLTRASKIRKNEQGREDT